MFADLHCHPGVPAYDENRMSGAGGNDKVPFDAWQIPQSDLKKQVKSKRAFGYSQSDPAKSKLGKAMLSFAALYPVEKGFFFGHPRGISRTDLLSIYKPQLKLDPEKILTEFARSFAHINNLNDPLADLVDMLQSKSMNFARTRVEFIQSGKYNYFNELLNEYRYLMTLDGKEGKTPRVRLSPQISAASWSGIYSLAQPATIQNLLKTNTNLVYVITIEGMHALGLGNYPDERATGVVDISQDTLLKRIRMLKGLEAIEGASPQEFWMHRPFFITFSHHFNNTLCGHAHSLPGLASRLLFDQSVMMNQGFSPLGKIALKALLGLNEDGLQSDGTPRIIIDVKHMSARGRREYYALVKAFNDANVGNKIPIVASHVGFAGNASLQDQIDHLDDERDNRKLNKFYSWNINLCAEDIIHIHNSEGLIGLSFDQRILGQDKVFIAFSVQDILKGKKRKSKEARLAIKRTIEAIAPIPFTNNLKDPHRIWSELSIGTDYDGFIDPLYGYSTALEFAEFEEDLKDSLDDIQRKHPEWFTSTLQPAAVARKICYENARDFVVKHYR